MVELVVLGLAGVVGTAWLTRVLARVSWRPVDRPNPRSLHVTPTPRVGGLAIFISVAASLAAVAVVDHSSTLGVVAPLLVSTGIVFTCSAWEDFRGLPPAVRLGIHGGAASLYLWWSGAYDISVLPWMPMWLSVAAVGFFIVWMANLYNFMDGADGLAGGMAIIGLAVIGIEAAIAGVISVGIVAFLASAAAAGFLTVNFPPARAFLGDAGSVSIGFLVAVAEVPFEATTLFLTIMTGIRILNTGGEDGKRLLFKFWHRRLSLSFLKQPEFSQALFFLLIFVPGWVPFAAA